MALSSTEPSTPATPSNMPLPERTYSSRSSDPQRALHFRWQAISDRLSTDRLPRGALIALDRSLDAADDALSTSTSARTPTLTLGSPFKTPLEAGAREPGLFTGFDSTPARWPPRAPQPFPQPSDPTSPIPPSQRPPSPRADMTQAHPDEHPEAAMPAALLERLKDIVASFRRRREESAHIHSLLASELDRARDAETDAREQVARLEADAVSDQAELRYLRTRMEGLEGMLQHMMDAERQVGASEGDEDEGWEVIRAEGESLEGKIRRWKSNLEDVERRFAKRRGDRGKMS